MNIFECIVISLCVIVIGLWGLMFLGNRYGLFEDEKKNAKKAYDDNMKRVGALEKSHKKNAKTAENVSKTLKKAGAERKVKSVVRTKNNDLKFPELPTEPKKRGRKPTKKGGHLD